MKDRNSCNRNARRTRALIEEAFLELIKEKPYMKISVREITERADVNRSTFYSHYQDIYDLLEQIEQNLMDGIKSALHQICRENYVPGKHPYHIMVFQELMSHEKVFRILFSKNGDIDFLYKLARTMEGAMYEGWSSYYGSRTPENLEMYVSYVVFGMIGILLKNLKLNCCWPPEKMGHLAGEVTNWLDEGLCGSDRKTKHEVE